MGVKTNADPGVEDSLLAAVSLFSVMTATLCNRGVGYLKSRAFAVGQRMQSAAIAHNVATKQVVVLELESREV